MAIAIKAEGVVIPVFNWTSLGTAGASAYSDPIQLTNNWGYFGVWRQLSHRADTYLITGVMSAASGGINVWWEQSNDNVDAHYVSAGHVLASGALSADGPAGHCSGTTGIYGEDIASAGPSGVAVIEAITPIPIMWIRFVASASSGEGECGSGSPLFYMSLFQI